MPRRSFFLFLALGLVALPFAIALLALRRPRPEPPSPDLPPLPRNRLEVLPTPNQFVPATQSRLRRSLTLTRKKKAGIVLAVLAVMAVAASAVAALILFTGSNGTITGGKIENSTTQAALTVITQGTPNDLVKGQLNNPVNVQVQNNDSVAHTPLTWAVAFTTPAQPACASHLSYTSGLPTGTAIPGNGTTNVTMNVGVANTLPGSCGGIAWVGTVSGTTNP